MKKCMLLVLALYAISIFSSCKKDSESMAQEVPETKPAVQTAVSTTVNGNCAGFYKALPARYDSTNIHYPLLIFIHGVGELGNGTTDLAKVQNNAVPRMIKNKTFPPSFNAGGKQLSFIVISPQFKNWPVPADVEAVVKYSIANYRIDTTRIYVLGLSMGGGATWEYGAAYASKIAAIVPICGASSPDIMRSKNMAKANLPVWAFHNTDDPTVSVNNTLNYVANINAQSPAIPAIKTIWATGGHDAWTKASDPNYKENGKNVYEWMLQYTRKSQ